MTTRKQGLKPLQKQADKLYQIKLIELKPFSVVSGLPTEVIHHYIPKSQSAYLRFDWDNGVPLTNSEHFAHHTKGDPEIAAKILKHYGEKWHDTLNQRRHIIQKTNKSYLLEIIEDLTKL
jgi:hypothetical protein